MTDQSKFEDNDDLTMTGRILDILRTTDLPEGCWDGAIEYIQYGGDWLEN